MSEEQGIYVTSPFHPNPKCMFFGFGLMMMYWFLPYRNKYILPFIFIVAYIAMAWYDYIFDCDRKLYSGSSFGVNTFDSWGKPQNRKYDINHPLDAAYVSDQEQIYRRNIYMFHAFGVAPFLMYVGYKGVKNDPNIFTAVFTLGVIAEIYHLFRVFNPR